MHTYLFRGVLLAMTMLLLCSTSVNGQKVNEDSLLKLISSSPTDTVRADALLALANYQIKHKQEDSLGLSTLRTAKDLCEKIQYRQGLLQVLLTTGNYYRSVNDWNGSLSAYQEIINRTERETDTTILKARMMAFNNLGNIFNFNGDFNTALSYRLKALAIAENMPTSVYSYRGIILLNITSDYRKLNMPEKAITYLGKVRDFYTQLPERLKMEYYYEFYENYMLTDSISATQSILDSIAAGLKKFNLSPFQRNDFTQMYYKLRGLYELNIMNDTRAALSTFDQSLVLAQQLKSQPEITSALFNKGLAYAKAGQVPESIRYFQAAQDSARSASLKNMILKSARELAAAWQKKGNMAESTRFFQMALELQEQIYDEEKNKQLNFLEARYQTEKKEQEIATLRFKNAESELALVKRNRLLWLGTLMAGALILILFLLYRTARQKKVIAEKEQRIQQDHIQFLERQQQVVSLQSMINGQESERTRIAKDLHDGLSGMFSTVKMYFSTLQHEKEDLKNHITFTKSVELIDSAADEIRRIAHNMMPEVLMKLGLVHAVQDMCSNISAGKLLHVQLQSYGMEKRLNASTEIMLYRIVQELLNNIMKHAQASEAIVQFNRSANRLVVTVEDNGRGFSLQESDNRNHAGLETIKSRVTYLNGNITIDSQQEIGTTVIMEFLINEENG